MGDRLNTTVDRVSHVEITFEFGSIKGSTVKVTRLTDAEYQTLSEEDGDEEIKVIGDKKPESEADDMPWFRSEIRKRRHIVSPYSNVPVDMDENTGENNLTSEENTGKDSVGASRRKDGESEGDEDGEGEGEDAMLGVVTRVRHKPKYEEEKDSHFKSNLRNENKDPTDKFDSEDGYYPGDPTTLPKHKKKKLEKPGTWKLLSKLADIEYLFNPAYDKGYTFRSAIHPSVYTMPPPASKSIFNDHKDDNIKAVYVSAPVNRNNERILLRTSAVSDVVRQSMVLKISFILTPPVQPQEEASRALARKINQLVYEKEFSLNIIGQDVDVVESKHENESGMNDLNDFCPWGHVYMAKGDGLSLVQIANQTWLYVNTTNTYNPVGNFDLWVKVIGNKSNDRTKFTTSQYAFVCLIPRIRENDCRRIGVSKYEYEIMTMNRSIVFENREYDIHSYEVMNETTGDIELCVPQSYDQYESRKFITVEGACGSEFLDAMRADGYLSLILGRISVAALALVLITYCLFKDLRSLPGCNTMNLTLALIVAQIIFTEGMQVSTPWLCRAVAITEHFSRLAAQFWMNVISYDVYQTFSKATVSRQFSKKKRNYLIKHYLYAWGVPLLIVGVCVFIDFSKIFPGIRVGYGESNMMYEMGGANMTSTEIHNVTVDGNQTDFFDNATVDFRFPYDPSTCWIGNPLFNLIAFCAPIFIILIINCIFFVRTIINISYTTKKTKNRLSHKDSNTSLSNPPGRADVTLYIRMSTVMGLTWVFGLIWSLLTSFVKVYNKTVCTVVFTQGIISTVFNVSQGIFIFIAFVCNRRVFSFYAELFARMKKKLPNVFPKSEIYSISSKIEFAKVKSPICSTDFQKY